MNAPLRSKPDKWIQTLPRLGADRGGCFDLHHPTVEMVDFRAMAVVLSRIPRFTAHTNSGPLSVAQHSREGAYAILRALGRRDAAAAFLLHDGHEYVLGDDATPKQHALAAYADEVQPWTGMIVRAAYRNMKERIDSVIYPAAGIAWPLPADVAAIVKEYDSRMGVTERDGRMASPPRTWSWQDKPVEGVDLYPWREGTTELVFRRALQDLCGIDTFSFT